KNKENLRMFEEIINEIFSEDELFDYVRFTRSPIKEKEKNIALIPNIDINIAFEVQSTDAGHNKIHAHILLAFLKHNTYISLNYKKIREQIRDFMGLNGLPYLNADLIRNVSTFEELKHRVNEYGSKYLK